MVVTILLQAILWIWFLGCITSYKFGKYTLVEGMGVKSAQGCCKVDEFHNEAERQMVEIPGFSLI